MIGICLMLWYRGSLEHVCLFIEKIMYSIWNKMPALCLLF